MNFWLKSFRRLSLAILCGVYAGLAPAKDDPYDMANPSPTTPAVRKSDDEFRLGLSDEAATNAPPLQPLPKPKSWFSNLFDQQLPVKFGINFSEIYSDNIFFQRNKTEDYITTISPFISATFGTPVRLTPWLGAETTDIRSNSGDLNYVQLSYRPTITLYAKNSKLNVVDQYAHGIYAHKWTKFSLSIEQTYEKLSQPTVEDNAAGSLILRDIYTTTARASYIVSDKLSTFGSANQIVSDYKSNLHTSSTEWNAEYYFLYQLFPKLSAGFGPEIGFVDIDRAPNQTYQSALFHLFYPASGKLSFVISAGGQMREFQDQAAATTITPIFEADATYTPFDSMTINLVASRSSYVSNVNVGQNYDATSILLSVRQRLFQVVYFTLAGSFQDDAYKGAGGTGDNSRDDKIYSISTGVSWSSKEWLSISGNYIYTRDDSNVQVFDFNENRFVVSATLRY